MDKQYFSERHIHSPNFEFWTFTVSRSPTHRDNI